MDIYENADSIQTNTFEIMCDSKEIIDNNKSNAVYKFKGFSKLVYNDKIFNIDKYAEVCCKGSHIVLYGSNIVVIDKQSGNIVINTESGIVLDDKHIRDIAYWEQPDFEFYIITDYDKRANYGRVSNIETNETIDNLSESTIMFIVNKQTGTIEHMIGNIYSIKIVSAYNTPDKIDDIKLAYYRDENDVHSGVIEYFRYDSQYNLRYLFSNNMDFAGMLYNDK